MCLSYMYVVTCGVQLQMLFLIPNPAMCIAKEQGVLKMIISGPKYPLKGIRTHGCDISQFSPCRPANYEYFKGQSDSKLAATGYP